MGKNIFAGVAGIIVAVAIVWLVEMIGHSVYPPPPGLDFADPVAMRAYMETLPIGAFLFVGGAWFLGTLGGTMTACRIGSAQATTYAMVVGGLMLLATAANLYMIPHPLWFSVLGILGVVGAAWLGVVFSPRSQSNDE